MIFEKEEKKKRLFSLKIQKSFLFFSSKWRVLGRKCVTFVGNDLLLLRIQIAHN